MNIIQLKPKPLIVVGSILEKTEEEYSDLYVVGHSEEESKKFNGSKMNKRMKYVLINMGSWEHSKEYRLSELVNKVENKELKIIGHSINTKMVIE